MNLIQENLKKLHECCKQTVLKKNTFTIMNISKEDFEVYDKHLDKDNSYKSLGNGRWYNDEMYQEALNKIEHMDYDQQDYQFALEVFKIEEGRDANMNDDNDSRCIAILQIGIKHQRLKEKIIGN